MLLLDVTSFFMFAWFCGFV